MATSSANELQDTQAFACSAEHEQDNRNRIALHVPKSSAFQSHLQIANGVFACACHASLALHELLVQVNVSAGQNISS